MLNMVRWLLEILILRPFVVGFVGLDARHRERLPRSGPAIIVANHNSHLDVLLLAALFPPGTGNRIRPVGAREYWMRNRYLAWCARLFGVIPISRDGFRIRDGHPLRACSEALSRNEILIIFPEGTRGEPGRIGVFKTGVAHLARCHPDVPVVPVFVSGAERVLPRGAWFPIPLVCDVLVGRAQHWCGGKHMFMQRIRDEVLNLSAELRPRPPTEAGYAIPHP